ncbi:MAG: tRNA (adenosine(37)-N6)-threonylcarbamoyltransferase complex ATPase subunit type 1 TsaE [Gammaproteobacteria bacterium]|nr:tRNA (adenosine(37)-N6)-threonylcarbamoyltransferase complex ATPase subunit type 1 TsaE [Gammaproteobacteria bacterium]
MLALGAGLDAYCKAPSVVYLEGELGAGKTTLVRGFLRSLGYQGPVKSPTYTLVESYFFDKQVVHHFDLYRLHDPEELSLMGIRDYFHANALVFIEWPQQGLLFLPSPTLRCQIECVEGGRVVKIQAFQLIKK